MLGRSGSGKSRWLCHWALQLIRSGHGVIFLDPHGDTVRLVLTHLLAGGYFDRPGASERLRYLDLPGAARVDRYIPLNVLAQPGIRPHSLTSHVREAFVRCWPELASGAPMFDVLVKKGVKVLISNGLPLTRLFRLLTDRTYRETLLPREADPDVVAFFREQYDRLKPSDQIDQAGAALRRADLLTYHPELKYALGASELGIPFRELLDRGQSLLVNLALADEETKRLYGSLLTVFIEQAALARADLPPGSRHGASFLIVDEFSSFSATSAEALATMLSQTRKYGLFTTLAHQNWTQASARLIGALQNVGLEVTFQTGRDDAERSARIVGRVDPMLVKKREAVYFNQGGEPAVIDQREREWSLAEQWEGWTQDLTELPVGEAYLKRRHGPSVHLRAPYVGDPVVDPGRLADLEAMYLETCFRPAPALPTPDDDVTCRGELRAGEPTVLPRRVRVADEPSRARTRGA